MQHSIPHDDKTMQLYGTIGQYDDIMWHYEDMIIQHKTDCNAIIGYYYYSMKHIHGMMGHRYGTIQPSYGLEYHSNSILGHVNCTIRHSHNTIEKCYGTMGHRCFIIEQE